MGIIMEREPNNLREKKKKKKRVLKKRHLILIVIGVYLIAFFSMEAFDIYSLKKQQKELQLKVQQLEEEKAKLEEEYNNINNLEYIEKMARENLKMVKPNEILYVDTTLDKEKQGDQEEKTD